MVFHHGKQTSNAKLRALHVGSGPAAMGQTELSDSETTPVKTEVCDARVELRVEFLWGVQLAKI